MSSAMRGRASSRRRWTTTSPSARSQHRADAAPMAGAPPALHDTGDGAPLLLLHAFPLDASQWDHQVAALSGRYRCLRPDYWGCGASPPPPGEPSLDSFAAAVLRTLDERGIDRFHVAGSSMGGYVAFGLLRQAAHRVLSLTL